MNRQKYIFIIVLLFVQYWAYAEESAWILLERGKAAYERRDMTQSMDFFLKAAESINGFPEAEYWLGRVYASQGQGILAEEQYRQALSLALFLRIPEQKYEILYALSDLLLGLGKERHPEALSILSSIADSEGASTAENIGLEHRYIEVLIKQELDELLFLYRDDLEYSLLARQIMGEQAWISGRYRSALLHSTRVVLAMLSTLAENYRAQNPDWRFDIDAFADAKNPRWDVRFPGDTDGVMDLIRLVENYRPDMLNWLNNSGFWAQVYLLSISLYAEGYSSSAKSLWSFLAPEDVLTGRTRPLQSAGKWGILAARQLEEPFIITGSLVP